MVGLRMPRLERRYGPACSNDGLCHRRQREYHQRLQYTNAGQSSSNLWLFSFKFIKSLTGLSELNYNPFTPRVRKTSAVDTLLDKFPFYRHVFRKQPKLKLSFSKLPWLDFAPSKLADKYRMQIEHVMGGEVCDKLDVNEHDFSKTILCIAEDKGKTLK